MDNDSINYTIQDNALIDNRTAGVMLEISYDGLVQGNTILGSGIHPVEPIKVGAIHVLASGSLLGHMPTDDHRRHHHPLQHRRNPSPIPTPTASCCAHKAAAKASMVPQSPRRHRHWKRRHALRHPDRTPQHQPSTAPTAVAETPPSTPAETPSPTTTTPCPTCCPPSDGRHPTDPQTAGLPSASGKKPAWTPPTPPHPQPASSNSSEPPRRGRHRHATVPSRVRA